MIILLNGTSSSGKSSIIASLLNKLDNLYFVFGIDKFLEPSMPPKLDMTVPEHLVVLDKSIRAFNEALKAYSNNIEFIIIDYVMQNPKWIHEVAKSLDGTDVFFVGVTAPLEIIEEREKKRPDRRPGTARSQYAQMQKYQYDLIVDSSTMNPDAAADLIIKNLKPGTSLQKYVES